MNNQYIRSYRKSRGGEFSPCTPSSSKWTSQKLLLFNILISLSNFLHVPREAERIEISKRLPFSTLISFSNFLHAPPEAQSVHLKTLALQYFDILLEFSPCTSRSSKCISKLLLFNALTSFLNFSPCSPRSTKYISQSFCSSIL